MTNLAICEVEAVPDKPPRKLWVVVVSVLAGLVANAGIFALLNSIQIHRPQPAPPQFAVTQPLRSTGILPPPTKVPDHSKAPLIRSYSVALHLVFDPFPSPPNPGKLERPLDHDHGNDLVPCSFCDTDWRRGGSFSTRRAAP